MPNDIINNSVTEPTQKPQTHSRRSRGREFWRKHVEVWQQSGLTKAQYAAEHSLSPATLYNCKLKLKKESTPVFVPVTVDPPVVEAPGSIVIILANGIKLSFPISCPPQSAMPWISELGQLA